MASTKKPKYYVRPDGLHETIRKINGKRVPFRGRTDAEVDRKMIEYTAEIERGRLFKDVASEWHEEHWHGVNGIKYGTQRNYNAPYDRCLEWFGEKPIKQIKPNDIKTFFEWLKSKVYAKKTVLTHSCILNMIFDHAISNECHDIEINPCVGVRIPKGLEQRERMLPLESDIKAVRGNVNDGWVGLFFFFILQTGARKGEALAITGKDIDLKNLTITIEKEMTFNGSSPVISDPKTEAGKREVPILDELVPYLPRKLKPDQLLFFPLGKTVYKTTVDKQIKRYRTAHAISCTAHQLRHGYAQSLYNAGVDLKTAQGLLGHAQLSTTADIYTHFSKTKTQEAAGKLNEHAKNTAQTQKDTE